MAFTQISTQGIKDGTITNADIGSSAAIAGTKISPDFGSQNIVTTGTLSLTTVAGTNTNASLNVLFQTASGVIDGGSGLTYNPAQDVLSVNGNHISRQVFRGDGDLGMLTCDNHSSTTFVNVSNTVDISTVDNTTDAFTLKQGSNEYITVDTNNSSELITLGNTTTNPKTAILGGNVGIGTTSPSTLLHANLAAENGSIAQFGLSGQTNNQSFIIKADDSDSLFTFRFGSTNSTYPAVRFNMGADAEAMRIDSSGRVLIGTATDNGFKFKVSDGGGYEFAFAPNDSGVNSLVNYDRSGNAYVPFMVSGSDLRFASGGNTERMRIDSSGRVGIGVTSANDTSTALTIKNMASGSEHTQLEIICDDNETSRVTFSETSTLNNGSIRYNFVSDTRAMTFHTNGNDERMRIDSTGDIGLGTDSPNLSGFSSPVTSIGKSANPYSVFELQGNNTSDGAFAVITGYNSGGSLRAAQINMNRDTNNNSGAISFETSNNGTLTERFRITRHGGISTSQTNQAIIGRVWTTGSLAAGETVNYDGGGGANTNSKLNFNSIGGNGGGHITCLSVSSFDQNPSGALIVAGVHGQGFNSYDTILNNFDSGISVTFNSTVTIQNTSSETLYYAVNVIHMGTGNETYYGR